MIASGIIALMLAGLILLYLHDRRQTAHTILRNYPVVGYFRYFAETLGEYMRQYQYLPDWAERPVQPAGTRLGVSLGQGGFQPAQLRVGERAGLRVPQRRLSGAGRGTETLAEQADRHYARSRRLPASVYLPAASSTSAA